MIESLHINGYRSLEDVRLRLRPLTVVTGPNGSGKSNLYRCLQLLGRAARGELARALVEEGGMPSVLWSGPRRRTSRRTAPARFSLRVQTDRFGYLLACGVPVPLQTLFLRDPEVKLESGWLGPIERASTRFLERDHASCSLRTAEGERAEFPLQIEPTEAALSQLQDPSRFPELEVVRAHVMRWRFYHHFRTDAESPLRQPQQGTRTPSLAGDGRDLAAALETIVEIGDASRLAAAVDRLQAGARLEIKENKAGLNCVCIRRACFGRFTGESCPTDPCAIWRSPPRC